MPSATSSPSSIALNLESNDSKANSSKTSLSCIVCPNALKVSPGLRACCLIHSPRLTSSSVSAPKLAISSTSEPGPISPTNPRIGI